MAYINSININSGCSCFQNNVSIPFVNDKLNVIYGANGSGKTSITKIFSLLSGNYSDEKKSTIFASLHKINSSEPLEITCALSDGTVIRPGQDKISREICVFNSDYIREKILTKDFSTNNFDVKNTLVDNIKNPLKEDYIQKKSEYEKAEEAYNNYNSETIANDKKHMINYISEQKANVDSRQKIATIMEDVMRQIATKKNIAVQSQKDLLDEYRTYSAVKEDDVIPAFIDEQYLQNFFDYKDAVLDLLKFSEDAEKTTFANKIVCEKPDELREWIKNGIGLIKKECCPFCNRPIDETTRQMINAFKTFAKSESSKTKRQLNGLLNTIIDQYKMYQDYDILRAKIKNFKNIMPTADDVTSRINIIEEYIHKLKDALVNAINDKLDSKNIMNDISANYNLATDNTKIDDIKYINTEISKLRANLKNAATNKKNARDNYINEFLTPSLVQTYSDDFERLHQLEKNVADQKSTMDISERIYLKDLALKKPLIKMMNAILNDIGLSKFQVDPQFNLVLNSKNISCHVNNYLSDGEKTVVSFALFIAEIKLKFNQNIESIVIDDPISSLDYDFIYNIKSFIDSLYKGMKTTTQFVVLTHNNIFYNMLKYGNNQHYGKLVFLTSGSTFVSSANEETIYMEKLKVIKGISEQQDKDVSLEQKTFIPNHCRFIIENVANFFYPNTNSPIDVFESSIRSNTADPKISKSKLDTLFSAIQIGSHSLLNASLDRDSVISDPQYKEMCRTTITIVKKYCPHQLELAN